MLASDWGIAMILPNCTVAAYLPEDWLWLTVNVTPIF